MALRTDDPEGKNSCTKCESHRRIADKCKSELKMCREMTGFTGVDETFDTTLAPRDGNNGLDDPFFQSDTPDYDNGSGNKTNMENSTSPNVPDNLIINSTEDFSTEMSSPQENIAGKFSTSPTTQPISNSDGKSNSSTDERLMEPNTSQSSFTNESFGEPNGSSDATGLPNSTEFMDQPLVTTDEAFGYRTNFEVEIPSQNRVTSKIPSDQGVTKFSTPFSAVDGTWAPGDSDTTSPFENGQSQTIAMTTEVRPEHPSTVSRGLDVPGEIVVTTEFGISSSVDTTPPSTAGFPNDEGRTSTIRFDNFTWMAENSTTVNSGNTDIYEDPQNHTLAATLPTTVLPYETEASIKENNTRKGTTTTMFPDNDRQTPSVATTMSNDIDRQTPSVATTMPNDIDRQTPSVATTMPNDIDWQTPSVATTMPNDIDRKTPSVATTMSNDMDRQTPSVATTMPNDIDRQTPSVGTTMSNGIDRQTPPVPTTMLPDTERQTPPMVTRKPDADKTEIKDIITVTQKNSPNSEKGSTSTPKSELTPPKITLRPDSTAANTDAPEEEIISTNSSSPGKIPIGDLRRSRNYENGESGTTPKMTDNGKTDGTPLNAGSVTRSGRSGNPTTPKVGQSESNNGGTPRGTPNAPTPDPKRKKQKGWFQRFLEVVKDVINSVTPFQVKSRDDGNLDIQVQ